MIAARGPLRRCLRPSADRRPPTRGVLRPGHARIGGAMTALLRPPRRPTAPRRPRSPTAHDAPDRAVVHDSPGTRQPRRPPRPVIDWFDEHARDLPWRRPEAGAWGVMVSEFMLQQTPVSRVLPVYEQWLARWPRPADLAAEAPGEAVRAWGRLGYPRRALRLHGAASAITERHGGDVPTRARAVARAARHRRVHGRRGRLLRVRAAARGARHQRAPGLRAGGRPASSTRRTRPPPPSASWPAPCCPRTSATAARWAAASMELGALVCTARNEDCARCPIAGAVRLAAGRQAGARGPAAPRPDVRGHRPAGARQAARRPARGASRRCRSRRWTRCGTSRCSGPARWTGWSPTASSSRWTAVVPAAAG